MTLEVIAPAKINTFLSVGPPDASGYHPLRSYFAAISLADTLRITPGTRMEITCNWPDLPAENTLTKVLRLLRELSEVPPCQIELIKAIPAESGLGGGSSDAAALLRGLHRLYPDHWSAEFMTSVAQAVGADVPFFLIGGLARAEGYGEKLTPLPDAPRRWLVVVRPDAGVPTAQAYRELDARERPWREFPDDSWTLYNDFERVMPCACGEAIERLQVHGATAAGLTGSGSAVFGLAPDEQAAHKIAQSMQHEGWPFVRPAHTLTREESLWMSSF